MRYDIYGNRRSTSSMGLHELYDEMEFVHYGEFEMDKSISIQCNDKKINGAIARITEKAIQVYCDGKTAWFPKSALRILPNNNQFWVVCRLAKWFTLGPDHLLLF